MPDPLKSKSVESIVQATNAILGEFDSLPDEPATAGQSDLAAKHGTPKVFAQATCKAIGTISADEARTGIIAYLKEWDAA